MTSNKVTHTCKYCHRVYVRENAFLAHKCDRMKKEEELKTPDGQAAWNYYRTWMKHKNRVPPTSPAFLASKYFKTFVKFVKFTKQIKLPMPEKFIWWSIIKDYPPNMWLDDEVYTQYLDFLDTTYDPLDQVSNSINTLLDYADNKQIDVSDIFEAINPNELIQLIRIRQVSPWLLLFSKKFKSMWTTRMSNEQQIIMETIIRPEYWGERLNQKPVSTKNQIKRYISELGI